MKIIFDFQDMSGGAPRSQLAHALVMKKAGHEVIATLCTDENTLREKTEEIRIIKVGEFNTKTPLRNIVNILNWVRLVGREKPDIVYANRPPNSTFLCVVSDISGVPIVVAQAGGIALEKEIKSVLDKVAVVYSKENLKSFLSVGFERDRVHVIANRLSLPAKLEESREESDNEPVKIIYAGNIKDQTIKGMLFLIDFLVERSAGIKRRFLLQYAGESIASGKKFEEDLHKRISEANSRLSDKGEIRHLGWVEDVNRYQMAADICIGKGRSVVQPAMMGKIAFVISEGGTLTRIIKETFPALAEFNFSGRGPQERSNEEFIDIIDDVEKRRHCEAQAHEAMETLRINYQVDYAQEKLTAVFDQALRTHGAVGIYGFLRGLSRLFAIYAFRLREVFVQWIRR